MATLQASEVTQDSMVDDDEQFTALADLSAAASDMTPPGLVLERYLHIGQAFIVLPLFAFFNAGVKIGGDVTGCDSPSNSGTTERFISGE